MIEIAGHLVDTCDVCDGPADDSTMTVFSPDFFCFYFVCPGECEARSRLDHAGLTEKLRKDGEIP